MMSGNRRRDLWAGKSRILRMIAILLFLSSVAYAEEWKELKGEHFLIYYRDGEEFANDVLNQAEKYYNTIASDLGYLRYDGFWQWENRAKIYIYPEQDSFMRAARVSSWIEGMAVYGEKKIMSYKGSKDFITSLLPHELTHLIFRDFVGFKGTVPLWLDEGVAQWEEPKKRAWAIEAVRNMAKTGAYIRLTELTHTQLIGTTDYASARRFYAQAVALVGYLITSYGPSRFTSLCQQLRDGKDMDSALSFVYADYSISNIEDLEKGWLNYYRGK